MKLNFNFNTSKYDLWEFYETIVRYYPIGLTKGEGRGIYFDYPGIKELEKIVVENVHDEENFQKRWVRFSDSIGIKLGKEMDGKTFGQAPSFTSSVILERNKIGNCQHLKELTFSVSMIGNYYQIYGEDSTTIFDHNNRRGYTSTNVITTSPLEDFKDTFEFVEREILLKYPSHRIVPFGFGQSIIKGLQVRYIDDEDCSINNALFNQFLNEADHNIRTRGEWNYGLERWMKV